ncbi:MAG TPA: restriction endonuclease subunit S [Flavobacteriales bacterium]|nr:restriction endonuclease subunit S [Flavobacteriales bacterium]HMR28886.1 restriction endonuclease subunit S [Flavobacteriales bacterium]
MSQASATLVQHSMSPNPNWAQLPLFDRSKWETVTFGDVVKCLKEQVDPESGEVERYVAGEHMDSADVHIRRWGTVGDGYLGPAFIRRFRKGQVLYGSRRTYLKKVSVADFDGVTANTTLVLEAKEGLLQDLLPWIMLSDKFTEHSVRESKGSVNPYINWSDIAWFEFALPPLDQQRRIAEVLWAVDETLEGYRAVGLANHSAQVRLREAHFERAVQETDTVSVAEAGKWVTGNTPSRQDPANWTGEYPWVSPKDMKVDVLHDTEDHLSEQGVDLATVVPAGSLMIVVRGMILAHTFPVCMTARDMAFNQDMKTLIPNDRFKVEYMFHWFKWLSKPILGKTSTTSHGTKRLMMDDFTDFPLPQTTIEGQERFIVHMKQFDEVAQTLENAQKALLNQRMALIASVT